MNTHHDEALWDAVDAALDARRDPLAEPTVLNWIDAHAAPEAALAELLEHVEQLAALGALSPVATAAAAPVAEAPRRARPLRLAVAALLLLLPGALWWVSAAADAEERTPSFAEDGRRAELPGASVALLPPPTARVLELRAEVRHVALPTRSLTRPPRSVPSAQLSHTAPNLVVWSQSWTHR